MKTKHIFYSIVVAASLTACTQDSLEMVGNEQDLSVRPQLGDIKLVENEDVATRFATGTGAQPTFENGDKLGACIMDTPKYPTAPYNSANPSSNYDIVEYYSSNNAFTLTSGAWKVDQPMVEGNYLFYAPYNQKMQLRTPFEVRVPAVQDASTEKSALDEFYASGALVRVGYQFLAAKNGEAQKPVVTMHDVFAYPMISIKNSFDGYLRAADNRTLTSYSGELKVDSIRLGVVDASGNVLDNIVIGGLLDNSAIADVTSNDWNNSPMANYTEQILNANNLVKNNAVSGDRTGGFITTLVANKRSIAKNATEVFYAVMPAMEIDGVNQKLQAKIYVTIGEKQYVISNATITVTNNTPSVSNVSEGTEFKSGVTTINLLKGQRYPQEELNFEYPNLTPKSTAGTILTLTLTGGKTAGARQIAQELQPAAVYETIHNNTEFITFFKDQLNGTALKEQGSTTTGANFVFSSNTTAKINSELIDALFTYNNKGSLQITTALVVDNDLKVKEIGTTANGYTPVTFISQAGNEYEIQLGSGYNTANNILRSGVTAAKTTSIHVLSGATLSEPTNLTVGNIRNDGIVTVGTSLSLTPTTFVNNGTLNVVGTVSNTVTNNGVINIQSTTASVTVNGGTGTVILPEAYKTATVSVNGGTQTGIYEVSTFSAATVKAGDAISWINAIRYNGTVTLNAAVLAEMKDITTVYATGAAFAAGNYDMNAKKLALEGGSAKTISGAGVATTVVTNVIIHNMDGGTVSLSNIAVSGIYQRATGAGKILADGENATWNGSSAQ